jgi:hypothetical protein
MSMRNMNPRQVRGKRPQLNKKNHRGHRDY